MSSGENKPGKISVQEYADRSVAEKYRQPILTLDEALAKVGWEKVDKPPCCGQEVDIRAFIGSPYFAECKACGKFIADVTGPVFHNSYVEFANSERVDLESDPNRVWIVGKQEL